MDYQITCVSDKLVFIRWFSEPESVKSENQFILDLRTVLDQAPYPIYVLSDLREGRLKNVETIRKLADLIEHHPHFATGTAFSQDIYTPLFVGLYSRYSHQAKTERGIWPSLEDALSFLESIAPGITKGIDWDTLVCTPVLE
ncbi:MAG TPA: hypothetical protein VHP83_16545 [Aggregatilineaceae bacterium]|nr:hypothetical protein [Aggregatilineaceae bacterium]